MKTINSPQVTLPAGHYSHATVAGKLVFVSGQLPFPLDSKVLPEGIEAQTLQALKNVEAVLISAGSSLPNLLNVQIFISDIALWPVVNQVYSEFLKDAKPARTIVPCNTLHYGALIEINAVAQVDEV
ncbi:RidA family protein [Saezia sanguinis]|uniref:RidA family protein n=1 Tax=Saezia sanguinis TaxID=1965230 RepID=UPI00305CE457